MATSTPTFDFKTMSRDEAAERRKRTGGGRRSKYSPVGDQLQNLGEGRVLSFALAPNQLLSLRQYVVRNFGAQYTVASRRLDGEQVEVYISATDPTAPRRGRKKKEA